MKFKHTFHVFVDNFQVTYKQLLYRIIIGVIAGAIAFAGFYPFIRSLLNSESFNTLFDGVRDFLFKLVNGEVEELRGISQKIQAAYDEFITLVQTRMTSFILSALLILLVYLVERWFAGLGNYATAAVINDKMALRANSPFIGTLIKNLKEASIYNAIYVPLSILYDLTVAVIMFFVIFMFLNSILPFLLGLFLFMCIITFSIAVKMTFTTDWLPALIRGKMKQKDAMVYTFSRKNKSTLNVLSNFVVLVLIIFGVNVAAFFCTFGVGMLITVPSSYVLLLSFEMVNYYDREEIKYSVDKYTIIKPASEHAPTREEFFRGEGD